MTGTKLTGLPSVLHSVHEERHVGRVQLDGLGVGVAGQQRGDGLVRVVQQRLRRR